MSERPLESYMQPVHDADCDSRRNASVSRFAAMAMDQAMGPPRCTCGLNQAHGDHPDEISIQCGYHYGQPTMCLRIQLNHAMSAGEWQAPVWMCKDCRRYVRGRFRYVKEETS